MNMVKHRYAISFAATTINPYPSVFIRGFILFALTGCAEPSQQVWSTKSDSMMGASTDLSTPALNAKPSDGADALIADRRRAAIELLLQASESDNALLRMHAIEALSFAPDHISEVARRGLGDENRGVRFAAAITIGRLQLCDVAPLVEPLLHDESQSVQAAAIYAVRRCRGEANPTPLAAMLISDDPEVKGNAAFVMGELGDKSGLAVLQYSVGKGLRGVPAPRIKIVELQMAEAMVKLGSHSQVEPIHAALYATTEESELTALACQICGRLRDQGVAPDLFNIMIDTSASARPAEVRLAAAMALSQVDTARAKNRVPTAKDVALEFVTAEDYRLRAQAAMTLGVVGDVSTLPELTRLMSDDNPLVQVAAAGAVLRFPDPSSIRG